MEHSSDFPHARHNLGIMYANFGKGELAEENYKKAIEIDAQFHPARFNLANLYNTMGRNKEAEEQLREVIRLVPENGEAHYSLGLLLAEMNRLDEAVYSLKRAVDLMPDRARIRYNYALTLSHLGRSDEALSEMIMAHAADRVNPGIVQTIAIFYIQAGEWKKAFPYAKKLVDLEPDAEGPGQMLRQIQQAISASESR